MSDLPTAQRADSRCAAGRPNHDRSIQEKNKENPERKVVPDLFRRRGFPTEKTYQDGAGFSLEEGGLLLLSAAREKKEKKAIRHRGVGAPNKGMSRNRSRDSMGLICLGKTMLRSGPLQGSGAPTSVREWDLPSHGFSRQLRCQKVSKGERREAGIQWIQPPKAVSDPEFRQTTSGAHGSANRADCLPRGKPFGRPQAQSPFPR